VGRIKDVDESLEAPPPFVGTILDALELAGMVGETWAAWVVFWKAIFAIPMNSAEMLTYQIHTGRNSQPTQPVAEGWQLIGRRGGKSRNSAVGALYLAIRRDYTEILAPGEKGVIPVIAADRKQARQVMNYLKGMIALEAFKPYVMRELTASVEFTTGVTIEIATASYRTTRGYTVVGLIADEIAFWRNDDSSEPDAEVLNALRPGMATVPDALLLALSSPYARKGELHRVAVDSFGKDDPDILVWNSDTLSMHSTPRLVRYVEHEFERDAVVAASEFGRDGKVVFRSDVEAFIDPEAIAAVTAVGIFERVRADGVTYRAYTDPSGGSQDAWTLAIGHWADTRAIVDAIRETRPPFSPEVVVSDCAKLLRLYGIREVWGDHYAGEFPRELFRKQGITYRVNEDTKSDIYREVLPAINAGKVVLLDHKRLKAELAGLERHVARTGQDTIDHAPGGHDDTANAVSGVLVLAARRMSVTITRVAI
jgi:roadblock/LC7 domain-containing protein